MIHNPNQSHPHPPPIAFLRSTQGQHRRIYGPSAHTLPFTTTLLQTERTHHNEQKAPTNKQTTKQNQKSNSKNKPHPPPSPNNRTLPIFQHHHSPFSKQPPHPLPNALKAPPPPNNHTVSNLHLKPPHPAHRPRRLKKMHACSTTKTFTIFQRPDPTAHELGRDLA